MIGKLMNWDFRFKVPEWSYQPTYQELENLILHHKPPYLGSRSGMKYIPDLEDDTAWYVGVTS